MNAMPAFMPHGMCFLWQTNILALHVISDAIAAVSYFCLALLVSTFVRRRAALRRFGVFFTVFLVACGVTHAMDVWTIWHPDYWLSGTLKAVAALASLGTAAALLPLMPFARTLRRFGDLDRINRELESQYRSIVETANEGIWLMDRAARTTFVNARAAEMLGLTAPEILGRPIADFLAGEHERFAAESAALLHAAAKPITGEWCFRRGDGTPLWAEINVRTLIGGDGEVTGVIAMVADASERHEAQAALAASERQYRLLAEAMPHPVFVADANGAPGYHNRGWYEYSGLSREQTQNDGWLRIAHPDDAARAGAAWAQAIGSGKPFQAQLRFRRASDGMYRWFVSRATPARDDAGAIISWIGSCADIHDFKLAAETRTVLDTLGHMISIDDDEGVLEYVSPAWAAFTGIPAQRALSLERREFVHPDDVGTWAELGRASREAPLHVQQCEFRMRTAHGTYRWLLARTVALPEEGGTARRRLNTLTDIDELKQTQAAYGYSETRYRALTEAMPQMIWIIDEAARLEYANEQWSAYTGRSLDSLNRIVSAELVHPDDLGQLTAKHDALRSQQNFDCELRLRRHDGAYRWHVLRSVALESGDLAAPAKWIVTATDIDARKSVEAALAHSTNELSHRAQHDPLTDLPNRGRLIDQLGRMIAQAQRDGTEIVVLHLDIDHFKTVNDTLGHLGGDRLLVETAQRISSVLRAGDTASRFGADEFVIVCASAGSDDAGLIAERIACAVRVPLEVHGKRIVVCASIGISVFPHDGSDAVDLIQKADVAMHDAKESGRNTWLLYRGRTHAPAVPALELEAELREAIALEQFVVYYQPVISVETGRPVGAEALVRWQHPQRGLLPPGEFISFAENHALIEPIGNLVLRAACAQVRRLNIAADDDFRIAVNVSAHQFSKPGFVASIAASIEASGLDARRLEIEITESVVMCDSASVIETLDRLEALGVKLSIDDFGTGYSSLAYIKNFPIHTLKIDRSFVSDIAVNFTDQAIAKTIITLAHSLGMRVIAEGVETTEQYAMLRSFGADVIQGYLFSKPLPGHEFEAFMRRTEALPH